MLYGYLAVCTVLKVGKSGELEESGGRVRAVASLSRCFSYAMSEADRGTILSLCPSPGVIKTT